MGILKKLFGGKSKDEQPRPKSAAADRHKAPPPAPDQVKAAEDAVAVENMNVKQLVRVIGQAGRERREEAALRLMELGDRTAIRPLVLAYLNYGDPGTLEAIRSFGGAVTTTAMHEVHDMSNVGVRRARLMDILAATGDDTVASAVRDEVENNDVQIHVRACVALTRLGDQAGIDVLAADLQQATKGDLRKEALRGLSEVQDIAAARAAIDAHLDRYLAEAGAIPGKIGVSAPRLANPDTGMLAHIIGEIQKTQHDLVLVIGSGAMEFARSRQTDLKRGLQDHNLFLLSPQMSSEEQMSALEQARDAASSNPEHTVLAIGQVPAPGDSPPLRHFLTPGVVSPYSCKIIIVDPHEYGLLMDWWHYVADRAEVPAEFEVVLSASTPDRSAVSEEEYLIYQLTPDDRRAQFPKALLAHF